MNLQIDWLKEIHLVLTNYILSFELQEVILMGLSTLSELSTYDLFCDYPLYSKIELEDQDEDLLEFINFDGTIDSYCVSCKLPGVFKVESISADLRRRAKSHLLSSTPRPGQWQHELLSDYFDGEVFSVKLVCARNENHFISVIFFISEKKLIKIGQYPSIASLASIEEMSKYRKVLSDEKYAEFVRAIGLASHGIGIGSFVYLRRIIEDLIEETHQFAIREQSWNEEKYIMGKVHEKIALLNNYLPPFLCDNRKIYSILSKGIHELSERECLIIFDVLRTSIELILDQKITMQEEREKVEKAQIALDKSWSDLKKLESGPQQP